MEDLCQPSRLPADGLYAELMARQPLRLDAGESDIGHTEVPFHRERIAHDS